MSKAVSKEELVKRINILNNSKEVTKEINKITKECMKRGAYLVQSRIKSEASALESFKNNKTKATVSKDLYMTIGMTNPSTIESFKEVDTVVDLLAMRVITNNAADMYAIEKYLKENYNPFIVIDGINEPLLGFEYRAIHMYFKLKIKDISFEVPMEIQLKTYDMHHAWAGLHDTIYKNTKVNLLDGCTLLPILFKIFEFNVKVLRQSFDNPKLKTDFSAVDCIIEFNKKLFKKYKKELKYGCFLVGESIYYDRNKDSKLTHEELLEIFNKIVNNNKKRKDSPLHLYGNRSVEYATYCIATNKF